ncbi:hypothetical protein DWU99_09440 [Dyella psychrodurans]|uniref:Type II secretion system protein n=2 Tax=Dyella psychrodurans TaxID=1927960 RepID=A0A370X6V1_9GAMM|nr:hypothetical protein DWU99_09440 [Dyella psychrodurans]
MGVRILLGVASIIMIGAVAAGLRVLGTPGHQRALQLDQRRVSELGRVSLGIHMYWTQHKSLPLDLGDVGVSTTDSRDPVTGTPYIYNRGDADTYSLCATFDEASSQWSGRNMRSYYIPNASDWKHPAGKYCFRFVAENMGTPVQ